MQRSGCSEKDNMLAIKMKEKNVKYRIKKSNKTKHSEKGEM